MGDEIESAMETPESQSDDSADQKAADRAEGASQYAEGDSRNEGEAQESESSGETGEDAADNLENNESFPTDESETWETQEAGGQSQTETDSDGGNSKDEKESRSGETGDDMQDDFGDWLVGLVDEVVAAGEREENPSGTQGRCEPERREWDEIPAEEVYEPYEWCEEEEGSIPDSVENPPEPEDDLSDGFEEERPSSEEDIPVEADEELGEANEFDEEQEDNFEYAAEIVGGFEGNYDSVQRRDAGIVSYGRYQFTLKSRNLEGVLRQWLDHPDSNAQAPNARRTIENNLERVAARDEGLQKQVKPLQCRKHRTIMNGNISSNLRLGMQRGKAYNHLWGRLYFSTPGIREDLDGSYRQHEMHLKAEMQAM